MRQRVLVPELMDDPDLEGHRHVQALRGLERINRWTGNAAVAWQPIQALADQLQRNHLTVLDVATGSGDVPISLWQRANKQRLVLDIDACDISQRALDIAAKNSRDANSVVHFFPLDVVRETIERQYDVVMCATFLHHLTVADAVSVLKKMLASARHQVIVVDLVRNLANWCQVWFACHLLSTSAVVRFDGPQSVRAAFTPSEVRDLASQAGMRDIQLRRAWPCRFVLVGNSHVQP